MKARDLSMEALGIPVLVSRVEKSTVVIDLGTFSVKCGFSNEARPRFVLTDTPSLLYLQKALRNSEQINRIDWVDLLLDLFQDIFFNQLHSKPKDRRVVVVVMDHASRNLVQACAESLLVYLEVPSLMVSSCSGVALFSTGLTSGVVVDIGKNECRTVAVCDGSRIQSSFVASTSEETSFAELISDGRIEDERSLYRTILECVKRCPGAVRPIVLQNILICGGGAHVVLSKMDWCHKTVSEQLRLYVESAREYKSLQPTVSKFANLANVGFSPELVPWVGGGIAASLETFNSQSITLDLLTKYPFLFDEDDIRQPAMVRILKGPHRSETFGTTIDQFGLLRKQAERAIEGESSGPVQITQELDHLEEENEDAPMLVLKTLEDPPQIRFSR